MKVDWIATDAMGKYTRALIEGFRGANPLDEDPKVMAYVDPAMPADLRALLQAWAHTHGSAWIDLGRFEIQKRSLGPGTEVGEMFEDAPEEEQLDWARTIVVGTVYGGSTLVVKWAPGRPAATWVIADHEYQKTRNLGTFEDVIGAAQEWVEERKDDDDDFEPPKGLDELIARADNAVSP